jgi:hypothetical protein
METVKGLASSLGGLGEVLKCDISIVSLI